MPYIIAQDVELWLYTRRKDKPIAIGAPVAIQGGL